MQALEQTYIPFDDYLEGERDVDTRSEYVDGEIYAMAGASETHNTIASSFHASIDNALKDTCRVWQSDMKVIGKTRDNKLFSYAEDILSLESVGLEIAVHQIYRRVRREVGLDVPFPMKQNH